MTNTLDGLEGAVATVEEWLSMAETCEIVGLARVIRYPPICNSEFEALRLVLSANREMREALEAKDAAINTFCTRFIFAHDSSSDASDLRCEDFREAVADLAKLAPPPPSVSTDKGSRPQEAVPTESQPISNARLAAELQAITLALRIGGMDGLWSGRVKIGGLHDRCE